MCNPSTWEARGGGSLSKLQRNSVGGRGKRRKKKQKKNILEEDQKPKGKKKEVNIYGLRIIS